MSARYLAVTVALMVRAFAVTVAEGLLSPTSPSSTAPDLPGAG